MKLKKQQNGNEARRILWGAIAVVVLGGPEWRQAALSPILTIAPFKYCFRGARRNLAARRIGDRQDSAVPKMRSSPKPGNRNELYVYYGELVKQANCLSELYKVSALSGGTRLPCQLASRRSSAGFFQSHSGRKQVDAEALMCVPEAHYGARRADVQRPAVMVPIPRRGPEKKYHPGAEPAVSGSATFRLEAESRVRSQVAQARAVRRKRSRGLRNSTIVSPIYDWSSHSHAHVDIATLSISSWAASRPRLVMTLVDVSEILRCRARSMKRTSARSFSTSPRASWWNRSRKEVTPVKVTRFSARQGRGPRTTV